MFKVNNKNTRTTSLTSYFTSYSSVSTVNFIQVNVNPFSANPEKWSNTLKQFVGKLPTNCLSVFDHFMNLALKGLTGYPLPVNC